MSTSIQRPLAAAHDARVDLEELLENARVDLEELLEKLFGQVAFSAVIANDNMREELNRALNAYANAAQELGRLQAPPPPPKAAPSAPQEMQRFDVEGSSFVKSLTYHPSCVVANFSGREYTFAGMDYKTFQAWCDAKSKGGYYYRNIRKKGGSE